MGCFSPFIRTFSFSHVRATCLYDFQCASHTLLPMLCDQPSVYKTMNTKCVFCTRWTCSGLVFWPTSTVNFQYSSLYFGVSLKTKALVFSFFYVEWLFFATRYFIARWQKLWIQKMICGFRCFNALVPYLLQDILCISLGDGIPILYIYWLTTFAKHMSSPGDVTCVWHM